MSGVRSTDAIANALAYAAIVAGAVVLIHHAWQVSPSTDDFCNHLRATSQSLPAALSTAYREWTGRIVTSAVLYAVLAAFDPYALRPAASALVVVFVLATATIGTLATIGHRELRAPACALALAGAMIGLYPLTGQTVFWITGAIVYTLPLALLLAWMASFRRLLRYGNGSSGACAGFVMSAIVGNTIELAVPLALVYGIGMLLLHRARRSRETVRVAWWRMAGIVAGAAILAFAPGNVTRAGATSGSLGSDLSSVGSAVRTLAAMLAEVGVPMLIVVSALVVSGVAARHRARSPEGDTADVREAMLVAAGGVASLLPMLLAPAQITPRNVYFALAAALVAAMVFAIPALSRMRLAPLAMSLLALCLTLGAATVYRDNAAGARAIAQRLVEQDQEIKAAARAGERDIVVAPVGIVPPRSVHFIELAADASRWDNRCLAQYYRVPGIRVGTSR